MKWSVIQLLLIGLIHAVAFKRVSPSAVPISSLSASRPEFTKAGLKELSQRAVAKLAFMQDNPAILARQKLHDIWGNVVNRAESIDAAIANTRKSTNNKLIEASKQTRATIANGLTGFGEWNKQRIMKAGTTPIAARISGAHIWPHYKLFEANFAAARLRPNAGPLIGPSKASSIDISGIASNSVQPIPVPAKQRGRLARIGSIFQKINLLKSN